MGHVVKGTCGKCGGPVVVPRVWHGVQPPTPQCLNCGAKPKQAHGPVMDMQDQQTGRKW